MSTVKEPMATQSQAVGATGLNSGSSWAAETKRKPGETGGEKQDWVQAGDWVNGMRMFEQTGLAVGTKYSWHQGTVRSSLSAGPSTHTLSHETTCQCGLLPLQYEMFPSLWGTDIAPFLCLVCLISPWVWFFQQSSDMPTCPCGPAYFAHLGRHLQQDFVWSASAQIIKKRLLINDEYVWP